jgi:hypothetical protein
MAYQHHSVYDSPVQEESNEFLVDSEPMQQSDLTADELKRLRKQSTQTFNIRRIPLRTINALVGE